MTSTVPTPVVDPLVEAPTGARVAIHDAMLAVVAMPGIQYPALVSGSVQIATPDPLACFAAARRTGDEAVYWLQPATERSLVGVGVAASIDVTGPGRFPDAAAAWARLLAGAVSGGPAAARPGAGPVLMGGATFADADSADLCWTGFERGRLDVPAILVATIDGTTILTANVVVDGPSDAAVAVAVVTQRVDQVLGGSADQRAYRT